MAGPTLFARSAFGFEELFRIDCQTLDSEFVFASDSDAIRIVVERIPLATSTDIHCFEEIVLSRLAKNRFQWSISGSINADMGQHLNHELTVESSDKLGAIDVFVSGGASLQKELSDRRSRVKFSMDESFRITGEFEFDDKSQDVLINFSFDNGERFTMLAFHGTDSNRPNPAIFPKSKIPRIDRATITKEDVQSKNHQKISTTPFSKKTQEFDLSAAVIPGTSVFEVPSELFSNGVRSDFDGSPVVNPFRLGKRKYSVSTFVEYANLSRPPLRVNRRFIPELVGQRSSFGPGWFSNLDYQLEYYPRDRNQPATVICFDPITEIEFEWTFQESIGNYLLADGNAKIFRRLEIENKTAILTRRNGWQYKFELVVSSPPKSKIQLSGRLVEMRSPKGFSVSIKYRRFTEEQIEQSPSRQFQIDQVTDDYGNVAKFWYYERQAAGEWLVKTIDINGGFSDQNERGDTLQYAYTKAGQLASVKRNGDLRSVYQYGTDWKWRANTMSSRELVSTDPTMNDTIFYSADYTIHQNRFVNQYSGRLLGRADSSGIRYMIVNRSLDHPDLVRVEYRGRLFDWFIGSSCKYYLSYTKNGDSFDSYTDLQPETNFAFQTASSNDALLQAEPEVCVDEKSQRTIRRYDDWGNTTAILYPDANIDNDSVLAFEKFSFDHNCQLVLQRNEKGNANTFEYSQDGFLLRVNRNLRDNNVSNDVSKSSTSTIKAKYFSEGSPEESTTARSEYFEYYPTDHQWSGLLRSHEFAMYSKKIATEHRSKTLFEYSTDGKRRLVKVAFPDRGADRKEISLYWINNQISHWVDNLGNETKYAYDFHGRLIAVETVVSSEEVIYHSDASNLVQKSVGNNIFNYQYDHVGRLVQYGAAPAKSTPSTSFADERNHQIARYEYQPGSVVPSIVRRGGVATQFNYDHRGRLISGFFQ